jgi:predicted acetyltransferase
MSASVLHRVIDWEHCMGGLMAFESARDGDAVARMISLAFGGTVEGAREWFTGAGCEHLRVVRAERGTVASLLRIPMGAYFGGRSVGLLGLAGVAVAPEARGRGHGAAMLRAFVREAASEGWALGGLYASTHALYRKFGYEHAGHRFQYTVPLVRIDVDEPKAAGAGQVGGWEVVTLGDEDDPEVRACYASFASMYEGTLDRSGYIWARVRKSRDVVYHGFGVRDGSGALRGYVYLSEQRPDLNSRFDVVLTDFVFLDAEAGVRIWAFLRDFAMMGERLRFYGGPTHPALQLLKQQRHEVLLKDDWLIRVFDVKRAMEARGYSAAIDAEVHLDVTDEVIGANTGRWVVRVKDGAAIVESGGRGEIRVGPRGLATIYSGFNTPMQAKVLGLADGTDRALMGAASVFARSTPWMSDMY